MLPVIGCCERQPPFSYLSLLNSNTKYGKWQPHQIIKLLIDFESFNLLDIYLNISTDALFATHGAR